MKDESGGGHDLPVPDQSGVLLRTGVGSEKVARVDRKIDDKARHSLAGFVDGQFARFRLAQPFDDHAARVDQVGIQPGGNDLLVIHRIRTVTG